MSKNVQMLLNELQGGEVANDLTAKLKTLATAVTEQGKAGKLTFTISMKPSEVAKGGVELSTQAKLTLPEASPTKQLYYVAPSGDLQMNDPRQVEMEFKGPTMAVDNTVGAKAAKAS